jgi:hypothetical protein
MSLLGYDIAYKAQLTVEIQIFNIPDILRFR